MGTYTSTLQPAISGIATGVSQKQSGGAAGAFSGARADCIKAVPSGPPWEAAVRRSDVLIAQCFPVGRRPVASLCWRQPRRAGRLESISDTARADTPNLPTKRPLPTAAAAAAAARATTVGSPQRKGPHYSRADTPIRPLNDCPLVRGEGEDRPARV